MEAEMAVHIARDLVEHHNCYLYRLVSDDDSSTRANLSHSYQDKLDTGMWPNEMDHWPRTVSGWYKVDNGELPLTYLVPKEKVADIGHRAKSFGKGCYAILHNAQKKGNRHYKSRL